MRLRVDELAKEIGIPATTIVRDANKLGWRVQSTTSILDASAANMLRVRYRFAAARRETPAPPAPCAAGTAVRWWKGEVPRGIALALIMVARKSFDDRETPANRFLRGEVEQAQKDARKWAEARLDGLAGDESDIIQWINLTKGRRPDIVAELVTQGVTLDEACLPLWYGRVNADRPQLIEQALAGRITVGEAARQVALWRKTHRTAS